MNEQQAIIEQQAKLATLSGANSSHAVLVEEVVRLREHVRMLRAGMELFCQRRDRGEIQSSTTYRQFKQLLELTKTT